MARDGRFSSSEPVLARLACVDQLWYGGLMNEMPNDDTRGAVGAADELPTAGDIWNPATDAGSEPIEIQPAGRQAPVRRAAPRAPSGDETLRRQRPIVDPAAMGGPAESSDPITATPPGERIAKAMARAGIASRRDSEAMVLAGRVSVNGDIIASPALNVTDADRIVIDGEAMPARERSRLWIFHKPRGLVTTARDPEGRQTVFEVLPEDMPRVVAIGRLDINTEGLLLLTNDGGLAKVIAHPDTGWLRRYRVRAHGDTDQAQLDRLAEGVTIDGMEYGAIEATLDRVQGDNLWLTLGLREGKNREVKRILEHLGLSVNRLIRLSFGPFQLGDLESGLVEEVKTRVLKDQLGKSLAEQAGVDFESPVREAISPFGGPVREKARTGGVRPGRDAARSAPIPRTSTGGAGSGPRRSAWSAEDGAPGARPARVPRRGADPRAAQAAAASERGRERVGAIRSGERRVVVERLAATPSAPVVEEAPRRRYADRGAQERPARDAVGRIGGDASGGRSPGRGDGRMRDASGPRDAGRPPRAAGTSDMRDGERRGGRPDTRRDRTSGAAPGNGGQARDSFRPRDGFKRNDAASPKGGFRDRKAAPTGEKPAFAGGKPSFGGGKKAFGGGKPGAGAGRGGPRAGAKPGGRAGGKPGGGGRPPRGGR